MAWLQQLITTVEAGLHLGSEPEESFERTIAGGVDRVLDRWLPLFRLLLVRSPEKVRRQIIPMAGSDQPTSIDHCIWSCADEVCNASVLGARFFGESTGRSGMDEG
jgi:hypothetical protein